jgi:biofilm PGA synthesis N-glycosyltransferase PgaC
MEPRERLLIVSAVRNEAAHLERVVNSVAGQTRPPDCWLVIDDESDDDTLEQLRRLEPEVPFMRVLARVKPRSTDGDRLGAALEAKAFNWALGQVAWREFDYVGKLDGDVELPPDYFERLLGALAASPPLGLCGATLVEPARNGGWDRVRIPACHVHGAVKLFRRDCFEAVGGIRERLGWDTIDETCARMLGWETRTLRDVVARHHRPSASAQGVLRGRARHGECAWILHYSALWVALRSLKVATLRPRGISGAAFACGYVRAALLGVGRVEDPGFRRFVRRELRGRMLGRLARGKYDRSSKPASSLTSMSGPRGRTESAR